MVPPVSVYGCWGDMGAEDYGGEYYAEMLKVVYPAIKAADPDAKVLIGGLLLDCDPAYPIPGNDCKSARFLEGILRNGGGEYFDIVSFHGYPVYNGSLDRDENFPSWVYRGGVVMGKVNYLREVMNAYGVEKPIMHTEAALICPEWNPQICKPPGKDFYEAQADFVVILYSRNWAANLASTIWYQFESPGWRYSSMMGEANIPLPAYNAFTFLNQELKEALFSRVVSEYPQIRGYEFVTPEKRIWVLWSPGVKESIPIRLPEGVIQVLDKYGNVLPLESNELVVKNPVYVELKP